MADDRQRAAVIEFRKVLSERLGKEVVDDFSSCKLIRFLVAREFDIAKATEMLVDVHNWRVTTRPQDITREQVDREIRKRVTMPVGVDHAGRDVVLMRAGRHFKNDRDIEDLVRMSLYLLELYSRRQCHFSKTCILDTNPPAEPFRTYRHPDGHLCGPDAGIVWIYDRTGFSLFKNFDMEMTSRVLPLLQSRYPELLYRALIVQVDTVFHTLFKMASVFLNERTTAKVVLLTGDFRSSLLDYADADQLPVDIGGTREEAEINDRFDGPFTETLLC